MNVFAWLNSSGHVTGWSTTRQDEAQVEMSQAAAEESKASDPESLGAGARKHRNSLLASCDWTQLADAPLTETEKAAWVAYRQALRDVPEQQGFPSVISWPVRPE